MNSRQRITMPSKPYRASQLNKSWTKDDIDLVLKQVREKRSTDEIAKRLNKSVSDIKSRLKAIAADMYLKDNLSYEKIHEITGIEKDAYILTSTSVRQNSDTYSENEREHVAVDISIYNFPEGIEMPMKTIDVNIQDNADEMIVTISVESPFSPRSICEQLSTPIMKTITTCSRIAKNITGFQAVD